ncbi:hypothetical protein Phum_PHUM000280 [Pediculus humanus corporis]|uniref:Uncharacterized protein n=1 Tax=Pediculus humanus subsp. corporis TaxID=121224 RepID=E0V8W0_PEDHC|nr:uncharacterized protein Phum_PHUM000280 [Pediculus humanus corporis]EEB09816.1 hypothetical protein Phum_PHUM000280 [Pediculus humanus corporis]
MTETAITVTPNEGAPHVKTDPGQGQGTLGGLNINLDYFKTVPGIIKLVQAKAIFFSTKSVLLALNKKYTLIVNVLSD